MSENVMSTGFMAQLEKPIGNHKTEEWDEISERLYNNESSLSINYEGTLIYSDYGGEEYGITFYDGSISSPDEFINECAKEGFDVITDTIKSYSCLWYNGVDSDMSMMKLENYK